MKERDYAIAKKLKVRLTRAVNLTDFKVYGSRVSETNDEFSDMDVYIQVESIDRDIKSKIYDIAWEIGFENNIVISVLVFTKEEVTNSPVRSSPIIKNIYQSGVTI